MESICDFVRSRRKSVGLTQEEFAERSGVALTVIRKIEQGKTNLNMDKVNLVLKMFGHELGVQEINRFRPETFSAVLGNLYDRGLIDKEELEGLLEEHISGKKFNTNGLFKDNRGTFIADEIRRIMEQNNLYDADRLNYLKL